MGYRLVHPTADTDTDARDKSSVVGFFVRKIYSPSCAGRASMRPWRARVRINGWHRWRRPLNAKSGEPNPSAGSHESCRNTPVHVRVICTPSNIFHENPVLRALQLDRLGFHHGGIFGKCWSWLPVVGWTLQRLGHLVVFLGYFLIFCFTTAGGRDTTNANRYIYPMVQYDLFPSFVPEKRF